MDDKPTQQSDTPLAKILPFNPGSKPHSAEPAKETRIPHELLDAISLAVNDAPWSKTEQADREALEEERAFRRRFGFTVNRARRGKVLDLKQQADLTDREIRMLWWTSNLDLNGDQAKITASRIVQVWGYIQMVVLGLLMLIGILKAVEATDRTVLQLVALTTAESIMTIVLLGVDYLYVRPYQILKRSLSEQRAKSPIVT